MYFRKTIVSKAFNDSFTTEPQSVLSSLNFRNYISIVIVNSYFVVYFISAAVGDIEVSLVILISMRTNNSGKLLSVGGFIHVYLYSNTYNRQILLINYHSCINMFYLVQLCFSYVRLERPCKIESLL